MSQAQSEFHRFLPDTAEGGEGMPLPAGKAIPFNWRAWYIGSDGVTLHWKGEPREIREFRFTVAVDLRDAPVVELLLAESGFRLGLCEVSYGCPLQTFGFAIHPGLEAAIRREGLRLRALDSGHVWILAPDLESRAVPPGLTPHLFGGGKAEMEKWERSFESLCSLASIQIFGWLEGCVLEGLSELALRVPGWRAAAECTIREHLDHFFSSTGMTFVSPRSEPVVDRWYNNEHGLMLPTLIRSHPDHPAIGQYKLQLLEIYQRHLARLERNLSCEGCYTIAYPLAMMARQDDNRELLEMALDTLLQHQRYLKEKGDLFLQYNHADGMRIYPFWARGVAWYLLGHLRVLQIAEDLGTVSTKLATIRNEIRTMVEALLALQNERGLWSCFAKEPITGEETSGSAGIAGALVLAAELGCADASAVMAAKQTLQGLEAYLSPDGLLSGVVQSNKIEAGEALQRYGIRCRSQMGQGLAVQLAALLFRQ